MQLLLEVFILPAFSITLWPDLPNPAVLSSCLNNKVVVRLSTVAHSSRNSTVGSFSSKSSMHSQAFPHDTCLQNTNRPVCRRLESRALVRRARVSTPPGHAALPMIRMLMRKTMMKKIHMKNLSITLATFFHSAPLAQVALCSRKQLAM